MTDKLRVFAYSDIDQKVFVYLFDEEEMQETVQTFHMDIWFFMTDAELGEFTGEVVDNLKRDFIWFSMRVNRRSVVQCTCGNFLESEVSNERGMDRMAKAALRHHQKTGHTINPRGN